MRARDVGWFCSVSVRKHGSPYWRVMRPQQWSKNAIVLAGVVFSGQGLDPGPLLAAVLATVAFCLASSAVYVFNDWHDREEDRLHPTKQRRPIAAGEISTVGALTLAAGLAAGSLVLGTLVSLAVGAIVLSYLTLMVGYTFLLRELAVVDILVISAGFLLRAWAGAVAVDVPLSVWLFACTLLLALLLGLGKRRHELRRLNFELDHHRPSLRAYARLDLDRLMVAVGILAILVYAGYTVSVPTFGRALPMLVTLPFAALGIGRYLFLVLRRNQGGAPEMLLIRDRPLLSLVLLWSMAVAMVLAS